MSKTKKMALICVLVALAIILNIVEAMLPPPLPIPGVKWGLANIVTIVALLLLGGKAALLVAALRSVLANLLLGSLLAPAGLMSFAGAIFSTLLMIAARHLLPRSSVIGVSVLGAVGHNLAQLAVASLIVEQGMLLYYLPILLIGAIPTGCITGFLGGQVAKRVTLS